MKCSSYIATSLDGLDQANATVPAGEDCAQRHLALAPPQEPLP